MSPEPRWQEVDGCDDAEDVEAVFVFGGGGLRVRGLGFEV